MGRERRREGKLEARSRGGHAGSKAGNVKGTTGNNKSVSGVVAKVSVLAMLRRAASMFLNHSSVNMHTIGNAVAVLG